jgi:hypothetical protein
MNKLNLLLTLAALCLLLTLGYLLLKEDRPQSVSSETERGPLLSGFSTDTVNAITIKRAGTTVELKKKDKDWIMPLNKSRVALNDTVTRLLTELKEAHSVGTRPGKNMADFDLTPEKRTEITIERETGKTTLLLGKTLQGSDKSVAQRAPGGPVLEIDKNLPDRAGVKETKGVVSLSPAWFYNLNIFSDNADDAIDVVIKKGNEVTRIQKVIPGKGPVEPKQTLTADEKPIWWMTEPEGTAADKSKMDSVCTTVLKLNVKEYADEVPEAERGLAKPTAKIAVRLKDGTERSIVFGKSDAQGVIISVSGKADVYRVDQYVFDACTKTEDMKAKEEKKETTTPAPTLPPEFQHPPVNPPAPPPNITPPAPGDKKEPLTIPVPKDKKDVPPPTIPAPPDKPEQKQPDKKDAK